MKGSGLDAFISKSLRSIAEEHLGEKTFKEIEQRLFEKYRINLTKGMDDFTKLDNVLREFFGKDAKQLEKQFLDNIIAIRDAQTKNSKWITILEPTLAKLILTSLGDEDKKNILNAVIDVPRTFMEILKITHLPPSSGYRKITALIDDGLLVELDSENSNSKRKIKYKSIFENISIHINKNNIIIKILLTNESIEKSFVYKQYNTSLLKPKSQNLN